MAGGSDSGSNFRSSYYDKAGIRCNLNETKVLDAVLSRNPVDIAKLCSLLQRISVPPTHRARLWKFILGVTPADTSIAARIEEDRRGQFEELKSTLQVMRLVDKNSSKADIVTLMILLERGELQLDPNAQMATPAVRDLQLMFGVMCRVAPKLQDAYWLVRNFYNHMLALRIDTTELINQTRVLLEKDDPALLERIVNSASTSRCGTTTVGKDQHASTGSMALLPIERWFNTLFASVLPDVALLKVWDKFLGGLVNKHLATTAKLIIVALKPLLMPATATQKLRQHHHLHHYQTSNQTPSSPTTAAAGAGSCQGSGGGPGSQLSINQNRYSQQNQQNQPQQLPQEQVQPSAGHPGQAPYSHHGAAGGQRQPLQNTNSNAANSSTHLRQQQQQQQQHGVSSHGHSGSYSQNQSPNPGTSPTAQQLHQLMAGQQNLHSLSSSLKQHFVEGQSPPQEQTLTQQWQQQQHQHQQQQQQQQLGVPLCCAAGAGTGGGANLAQLEGGHHLSAGGIGCVSGSVDIGDLLQRSQLATILNQPLSDDMAAPLVAIL